MTRRFTGCAVTALLLLSLACGDSPTQPGPVPPPPPPPPPANNAPPVLESIALSTQRVEANEDVTATATVRDAETPVDQLRFDWSADVGTFSGTGPVVRWRFPRGTTTPADVVLRLTVVETYGTAPSGGTRPQQSVSGSSLAIRAHDSASEIGELALRFLRDFATSTVPADAAIREFSDTCSSEKQAERQDIANNRRDFEILSSQLNVSNVAVTTPWSRGTSTVQCRFSSRRKNCPSGSDSSCRVGAIETVEGNCNLRTVYEQQRWFLCESTFQGTLLPSVRGFFGRER